MLENRSFDHLLGGLKSVKSNIAGLTGAEFNPDIFGTGGPVTVRPATSFSMSFDPGHEFEGRLQMQLYGFDPSPSPWACRCRRRIPPS